MKSHPSALVPAAAAFGPSPAPAQFPHMHATDRAAREEIQHRAYALWLEEGEPAGRAEAHWLQAEADVLRGS